MTKLKVGVSVILSGSLQAARLFPKRNLLKYLQDPKGLVEGISLVAGRMRKDLFGSVEHSSTCF